MEKNNLLVDSVTFGTAKTAAAKYADSLAAAIAAYTDPNGNLDALTLPGAVTELAAEAAALLAQLNALDGSMDTRYTFNAFATLTQALLRHYESRIATLETQVAAIE